MRRPRRAAAAVGVSAVLVLLAGLGVVGLRGADTTTSYDEQSAVDAFRSGTPSPTPEPGTAAAVPTPSASATAGAAPAAAATAAPSPTAGPPRPAGPPAAASPAPAGQRRAVEPGVYRYATEGYEQVDALGGARHDYPATSTITYSRKGCGSEERWQPLEERIGVTSTCPGSQGGEVRATYQQREFFGQSQSQSYTCDPGLLVLPDDPRPGRSWTGACTGGDSTASFAVQVLALEQLDVAGQPVPVVRLKVAGTLTGSTRGTSDREVWLARADGLLVQAVGDTDTDADTSGGTVRYRESYRLRLQSLEPSR